MAHASLGRNHAPTIKPPQRGAYEYGPCKDQPSDKSVETAEKKFQVRRSVGACQRRSDYRLIPAV